MRRVLTNLKRTVAVLVVLCLMFSLMPANTLAFQATDISGHWAQVKIQSWIDKGLIKGYPDGTFKPDQDITRAEFMTLANRAFGYTTVVPITYTDVKAGSWYAPEVAKAQAAGYITGYPDGTMKPENPITREEVATIIARIKNLTSDANAADKYSDAAKIGSWSKGQVGAVTSAKIMQGYPDGSFMPQGLITRVEVVVALDNALHYTAPPAATSNVAVSAIGDVTILVGGITTKTVTTIPADATITAVSGTTAVAVVNVTGHNITVTGVSAGTSKITVTGSKSGYGNGIATWTVTVVPVPIVSGGSAPAPAPTTYPVTFTVADATYAKIDGASITIASQTIATDVYGVATINLGNGTYPYGVTATGYDATSGSAVVNGAAVAVPVTMTATAAPTYAVTLGTIIKVAGDTESTVTIATSPAVAGATVTLTVVLKAGMQLKADTLKANYNDGSPEVATLSGTGPYTFTMPAYAVEVTAEFEEIPAYAVTFTVGDGVYAIDGASITIASQTIATDVYGRAIFNLADGTYVYDVTKTGYDATSGSAVVNGAALPVSVTMTALSSDATLKASSTVKGETLLGLGRSSASGDNWSDGGTVTITAAEAANTTNRTPYITLFDPTDAGATVKVVKYSQWSNNGYFDSLPAYANQAIINQDYFWVKVTAPDTTTLYYKVNVTVTP